MILTKSRASVSRATLSSAAIAPAGEDVAAFLLPELVNHLLAGGFMSVTFIPIFQRHVAENRRDLAWKAFSNLLTTGTAVLAVTIGLGLVFTENLLGLMGKQIADPCQLALATRMTRIILPAQFFYYWGALLLAVQYADKRFFVPALAPLLYNVGIILGGVALAPFIGIEGFIGDDGTRVNAG